MEVVGASDAKLDAGESCQVTFTQVRDRNDTVEAPGSSPVTPTIAFRLGWRVPSGDQRVRVLQVVLEHLGHGAIGAHLEILGQLLDHVGPAGREFES